MYGYQMTATAHQVRNTQSAPVPKLALSDRRATKARSVRSPLYREIHAVIPRSTDHIPLAAH
jgi:hypothetical protein